MATSEPRWLQLLRGEASRTSIGQAAAVVQYSRTTVSQVLDGKYPGDLAKVEAKVLAALDAPVACPYLQLQLPAARCRQFSERPAPMHNPFQMIHWKACSQCQNKRKTEEEPEHESAV
jgi:hypothetical protein